MSSFQAYAEDHGYRLSNENRASLFAVLPKRKTAAFIRKYQRESKEEQDRIWAVQLEIFVENLEAAVGRYFDPRIPRDGLPSREFRDEMNSLASHARAVKLAINRLSKRDRMALDSGLLLSRFKSNIFPDRSINRRVLDAGLMLVEDLAAGLEMACRNLSEKPIKRGIEKRDEFEFSVAVVCSFESYVGKASASQNGTLRRVFDAVKDFADITVGEDLLKRAIREYGRLGTPEGDWKKKTA